MPMYVDVVVVVVVHVVVVVGAVKTGAAYRVPLDR